MAVQELRYIANLYLLYSESGKIVIRSMLKTRVPNSGKGDMITIFSMLNKNKRTVVGFFIKQFPYKNIYFVTFFFS